MMSYWYYDDYGSHSGPRESGGRGAESPLPPPLTHTSPTRFWQELKLRQNCLLQTTSDYYLPPWITTYPLEFPDLPTVLMMTWEAAQAWAGSSLCWFKVPIWIECVILTQDFHHKDRGGNGHLHILWTAKTSVTRRTLPSDEDHHISNSVTILFEFLFKLVFI